MVKLTDTGADVAARCAVPGWMRWVHSTRDGLAHAFPVEDSQQGRWLRVVCSATGSPAVLGPVTVVGPRCVLAVAAAGAAWHRRDRPGTCIRLLARLRRRPDPQSPPSVQVPDITLPPTTVEPAEHAVQAPGTAEPGAAAQGELIPPPPVHHYPRVAR